MRKAGYEAKGQRFETPRGTQGGVISRLLSNILLTPFDKEMRQKGYRLTRWADDWVVTCRTLRLHLTWTEKNGPVVQPPAKRSFGTRLIETLASPTA
jgi:two-component sensor histidine kinase